MSFDKIFDLTAGNCIFINKTWYPEISNYTACCIHTILEPWAAVVGAMGGSGRCL